MKVLRESREPQGTQRADLESAWTTGVDTQLKGPIEACKIAKYLQWKRNFLREDLTGIFLNSSIWKQNSDRAELGSLSFHVLTHILLMGELRSHAVTHLS